MQKSVADQNDKISEAQPSHEFHRGFSLHIFEEGGYWHVWLNNDDHDFTGLCLVIAPRRQDALSQAVTILEAGADYIQSGNA